MTLTGEEVEGMGERGGEEDSEVDGAEAWAWGIAEAGVAPKGGRGSAESFSSKAVTILTNLVGSELLCAMCSTTVVSSVVRSQRANGGGRDQGRQTEKWASVEGEAILSLLCEIATGSHVPSRYDLRGKGTNPRAEEVCEGAGDADERRDEG